MGKPTDLVEGTLDFLILKAVELEPRHGWGIAKRIQQISGDVIKVPQGSLYPALYRLERQGWIIGRPGQIDEGEPSVLRAHPLRSRSPARDRELDRSGRHQCRYSIHLARGRSRTSRVSVPESLLHHRIQGVRVMPTSRPSGLSSRVTVCPHGSSRASTSSA